MPKSIVPSSPSLPPTATAVGRLQGRFFYRMAAGARPQWILTYPEQAAPRTGDGLFEGDVIDVVQVKIRTILIGAYFSCAFLVCNGYSRASLQSPRALAPEEFPPTSMCPIDGASLKESVSETFFPNLL